MTALSERDRDLIQQALALASLGWERWAAETDRIDDACHYRNRIIDARSLSARLAKATAR